MKNALILADMIIQIMDNGKINDFKRASETDALEIDGNNLELFNTILVAHKKRYGECYTDCDHTLEIANYLSDCRFVFKQDAISDSMLEAIFLLSVCENYRSAEFREICASLATLTKDCGIYQMRYLVYQRVLSYIISFRLYTQEPFISIMRQFTKSLEEIKSQYGIIINQLFLE